MITLPYLTNGKLYADKVVVDKAGHHHRSYIDHEHNVIVIFYKNESGDVVSRMETLNP